MKNTGVEAKGYLKSKETQTQAQYQTTGETLPLSMMLFDLRSKRFNLTLTIPPKCLSALLALLTLLPVDEAPASRIGLHEGG